MLSPALKNFHDAVFVVTAPGFDERQEHVTRELGAGNFEFVYGINKSSTSKEELIKQGIYDEERAIELDRSSKPMTLGAICCSVGHRLVYERFLASNSERCLIFEDDVIINESDESVVQEVLSHLPPDAELIYWGWQGGGYRGWNGVIKQALYHLYYFLGFFKYDHTMISNMYARPHNEYFDRAGKHLLAHAYSITRTGAEALLRANTPVVLNADNLLMYAVLKGGLSAYVSKKQLFGQKSIDPSDPMTTLQ